MKCQKFARIAGLLALLAAAELHGATITWTNTSGGNWGTPANWDAHVVPGTLDTAAITVAGTYTVTLDTAVNVYGLTLGGASGQQTLSNSAQTVVITNAFVGARGIIGFGGGTISGGLMTNQGTLNWSGGTLALPVTNAASGTLNLNGTSVNLYSAVTNSGTIRLSGSGSIILYNNHGVYEGALYNQSGGLLDLQVDQGVANGGSGFEVFVNAGTLRKSSGTGTSTIGVAYTNSSSALADAESGTIQFTVGGNLSGNYNTAAGASIQFVGGTYNETGPVTVTGSGLCQQSGATVILNDRISQFVLASGNVVLSPTFQGTGSIQSLQLSGATLTGTNTVTGTLGISGGALGQGAVLTVKAGGILDFNGAAANIYGPLTNAGTVIWTGNGVGVGNNGSSYSGVIANQSGGLFLIQSDQSLFASGFGKPEVFLNAGTVRKTAGLGTTTFTVGFTNTGVVDAESGTIQFQGGGNIGGNYNTASGATIQLVGGSYVQSGAASVTGSGLCRQNGAGANVTLSDSIANFLLNSGNVALSPTFQTNGAIHSLQLDGATLTGSNVVTGTLTMNGGAMGQSSPLTVSNGAVLNVTGSSIGVYSPLTNAGTINWINGSISVGNNGSTYAGLIANQPGGLFLIQCDQSLSGAGFGAPEVCLNAGTLRKIAGVGTTTIGVGFTNSSLVDAESGIIQFQGGGNIGGTYNAASGNLIQFNGGTFVQSGAPTITGSGLCRQNGATVRLSDRITNLSLVSGNVVLIPTFQTDGNIHNLQLDGATLTGTNVVVGTLTMNSSAMAQSAPLTIAGGGVMNLGGGSFSVYSPLTNNGTINWTGGTISVGNNGSTYAGVVNNQPSGLFLIQSDQGLNGSGFGGPEFFLNSGTVRKTAGIATTIFSAAFTNSGTLDVQSGIIHIGGPYGQTGGTMNFGITSLAQFGQITFVAGAPLTGTISANLNPEYSPNAGDSFPLVTYTSHSGIFTSASLPLQAVWQTNYSGTTFTLSVLSVVTNLPSAITLKPISLTGGQFTIQVNGSVGPEYIVEASSNFIIWTGVSTSTPVAVPFDVVDPNAGAFPHRFYRAKYGP